MNYSDKLINVRAVVFEGPDCCGKSTQVNSFINTRLSHLDNDVIIKIHFPFNITGDNKLKTNYNDLVNTIYSENFFKNDDTKSYENNMTKGLKLYDVLRNNIIVNSSDKQVFLFVLAKLLYGNATDIYKKHMYGNNGASIKDLLSNPNCQIWFNNNLINTNYDEELKMVLEYFKTTNYPSVLLVFDRFIMSGIIYNYLLPRKVLRTYHLNGIINDETYNNLKVSLFETLESLQKQQTSYEIDAFNEILRTSIFNYSQLSDDGTTNYCNPKVLWFVFRKSDEIYQAFLNDKTRKIEAYDSNITLRKSVNDIFENIIMYDNESVNLLNNKFNMVTIDSDDYIASFGEKSKEIITVRLNDLYQNNLRMYTDIEKTVDSFLTSIHYKK